MIKVHCHTNIDDYGREIWPRFMLASPHIGDIVKSESGKILRVCGVAHPYLDDDMSGGVLQVELHR